MSIYLKFAFGLFACSLLASPAYACKKKCRKNQPSQVAQSAEEKSATNDDTKQPEADPLAAQNDKIEDLDEMELKNLDLLKKSGSLPDSSVEVLKTFPKAKRKEFIDAALSELKKSQKSAENKETEKKVEADPLEPQKKK